MRNESGSPSETTSQDWLLYSTVYLMISEVGAQTIRKTYPGATSDRETRLGLPGRQRDVIKGGDFVLRSFPPSPVRLGS